MKHFGKITAGFLLNTALSTSVFADEITMWTMEEQPEGAVRRIRTSLHFCYRHDDLKLQALANLRRIERGGI